MKRKLYLAYGSNMSVQQMHYRCPDATILGVASIKDHRLLYKGSKTGAYATIEPAEGYEVPVLVWYISENDEKNLDRYEGYPTFYYKKNVKVEVKGISKYKNANYGEHTAMVYVMDETRPYGLPSKHYEDIIKDGYKLFGFDKKILQEARKFTAQNAIRKNTAM